MAASNRLLQDPILATVCAEMQTVPGVVAMGLGGSRSIGTQTPDSDYDVILFIDDDKSFDSDGIAAAVARLGGNWTGNMKRPLGEVTVSGRKVELLFRAFDRYDQELAVARKGEFARSLNPLHSIGFLSTVIISYVTYVRPFWDPDGKLAKAIERAYPYPDALRAKMLSTFRTEAKLALMHAAKTTSIHDVAHLSGLYVRAIAAWGLVLFALNRQYPIIDKGGRQVVAAFPTTVRNYDFRIKAIVRAVAAGDVAGALGEANRIHGEVCDMIRDAAAAQTAQLAAAQ